MIASTNPVWIQTTPNTLTEHFEWVGLRTNIQKTVGMVFQPRRAVGARADKAYKRRITGEGKNYQERQRGWVQCTECGKDLARGLLAIHFQTQNGVERGGAGQRDHEGYGNGGDNTRTFRMTFQEKAGPRPCPVEGCSVWAATRTSMWVHLWYRYVRDTMVILKEGNITHPRCLICGMMVPWWDQNRTHRRTAQCRKGEEQRDGACQRRRIGRSPPGP